jgi:hypothetical protein
MGSRRHDVIRAGLLAAALLASQFAITPAVAQTKPGKRSAEPNRFGAIAYNRESQSWGVGFNFARARDANVEALKECGNGKCEVVHKFRNGCAALAVGPKIHAATSGATRDEAEAKTLRRCTELNKQSSCKVLAWACTR